MIGLFKRLDWRSRKALPPARSAGAAIRTNGSGAAVRSAGAAASSSRGRDTGNTKPAQRDYLAVHRVEKSFGGRKVVQGVNLYVRRGEAVGLLGPNGAGKSTMIKALLGFLVPERGRLRVLGLDVAEAPLEIRARVGYMPETDGHIPGMNAVSFVAYCGELAGLPRVDAMQRAHEVLFYVGLGEARYRNVETYSTGMKQRIKLAQALVHDPDLVFLDEPTNGMDPKGRDEMLELVRDLARNKGVNLILSSHLLPDVEYTCDQVVVMDKGRIAAAGPIDALKQPRGRVYELRVKTPGELDGFFDRLRAAGGGGYGRRLRRPAGRCAGGLALVDREHAVRTLDRDGARGCAAATSRSGRAYDGRPVRR